MKYLLTLIIIWSMNFALNGMAGTEDWNAHVREQKRAKRERLELQRQLLRIGKYDIWRVALRAKRIADTILWEIEFKEKFKKESYTIFYPKADYREKWEQELEKELRLLRPMKVIHPPVLLSKPKPQSTKQLFPGVFFYPKINAAQVASLTACLNESSIRFDKSFTKKY